MRFGFVYNIVAFFILVVILITLITLMVVGLGKRGRVQMDRKFGNWYEFNISFQDFEVHFIWLSIDLDTYYIFCNFIVIV